MEYKPYSADPKDKKKTTTQMMKPAAPDSDRDVPLDRRDINRQPSSAPTRKNTSENSDTCTNRFGWIHSLPRVHQTI